MAKLTSSCLCAVTEPLRLTLPIRLSWSSLQKRPCTVFLHVPGVGVGDLFFTLVFCICVYRM